MDRRALKRAVDVLGAGAALVALSPLLGGCALAVRLGMGRPVLFRQQRPGLGGKPFTLLKLRTMTETRGADGTLLPDAQRLTPLGHFLRSTSLDELPELVNVLKGEMSLVGPRPLLTRYLGLYTPEQSRRHEVPPGITGWAQVNGRNARSWVDRFALDLWYVDHWTLWLDVRIMLATWWKVLTREGISLPGEATAQCFDGDSGAPDAQ